MTRTKIFATFADGTRVARRTDADYHFASRAASGNVRFHSDERSAERAAGARGEYVPVENHVATRTVCVVCDGTGTVTYGPRAGTDNEFSVVPCHRCAA
jgi:hypothetical protein